MERQNPRGGEHGMMTESLLPELPISMGWSLRGILSPPAMSLREACSEASA
jgi:hypothetical protein